MKRRKFLTNLSLSAAGISVATSCSGSSGDETGSDSANSTTNPGEKPQYREQIKTSFSKSSVLGSGEKVVLALIGAGHWGTNLVLNVIDINANVEVKYICDVDDTRGGRAMKEVTAKQNHKPIRCISFKVFSEGNTIFDFKLMTRNKF